MYCHFTAGKISRAISCDEDLRITNNWLVRQDITVTDYSEANRKALSILMKGIDSLGFIISDPESINDENFKILL